MNDILEFDYRRTLPIIFAVNTSGSMAGVRLIQLNSAMQELSYLLEKISDEEDVRLQIRVIEYNSVSRWLEGTPENPVEYMTVWFSEASGTTNTAEALKLARSVMSYKYFGPSTLKPILILVTDSNSDSPQKTLEAIDELKSAWNGRGQNKILRIALRIGDESIPELEVFASTNEEKSLIFDVDDLGHITEIELLKYILKHHNYTHDIVVPDDEQIISLPSDWDDDWEE